MQTFLPFPGFAESAATLDRLRLGKQRVETMQIMEALLLPGQAPKSIVGHPATKMWRGYEYALLQYQFAVCDEWTSHGYKDTCRDKTEDLWKEHAPSWALGGMPKWLGDERFHESHRQMLLAKNEGHYRPFFPDDVAAVLVPGQPMPYAWPVP